MRTTVYITFTFLLSAILIGCSSAGPDIPTGGGAGNSALFSENESGTADDSSSVHRVSFVPTIRNPQDR